MSDISNLNILAVTGAGLSVESGIQTYRGPLGIYDKTEQKFGLPIEAIVSSHTVKHNPELFWSYWLPFYQSISNAKPNFAHDLLKKISIESKSFLEVTQNIDGLSLKAGVAEDKIIEIHGSAHKYFCIRCGLNQKIQEFRNSIPVCTNCIVTKKSNLRPKVVLFKETIKAEHYKRAIYHAQRCDVILVIGTELHFSYLTDILIEAILRSAKVYIINPADFEDMPSIAEIYSNDRFKPPVLIKETSSKGLSLFLDSYT